MLDYGALAQNPYHNNRNNFDAWSILPMILGGASAMQSINQFEEIDIEGLKDTLGPWAAAIGFDIDSGEFTGEGIWGKGESLMDIGSDYNQKIRQNTMGIAQDSATSNIMNLERLLGPNASGILTQQGVETSQDAVFKGQESFMNSFFKNQQLGANLQNNAVSGVQGITENLANADIQNTLNRNAMNSAAWGGLAQGLFSFIPGINGA